MAETAAKKSRKSRFSAAEISALLQRISANKILLNSKLATDVTNRKKKDCWKSIREAVDVSDQTAPTRSVEDIKKKWNDLKEVVMRYRMEQTGTGGGEAPEIPPYFDTIMDIIGDKKALLHGITDTGSVPVPDCGWDNLEVNRFNKRDTPTLTSSPVPGSSTLEVITINPPFSPISFHTDPALNSNTDIHTANTHTDTIHSIPSTTNTSNNENAPPTNPPTHTAPTMPSTQKNPTTSFNGVKSTAMRKRKLEKTTDAERENNLWCQYLEAKIGTKSLEKELLKADIELKETMNLYYLKKIEKLNE